ncbi:hypothetical protein C8A00DRAFT_36506 [Chaetomidium leptoderma]|uniref:Uncharacterized protein n=1 Tax=Chaetomidium leptoderma TaxID=669021 RepID=A0AAN6VG49_9PEZI|nr:hypothetical protein C8A00DRAFT_36506 [Chaetomidium leptoderma]
MASNRYLPSKLLGHHPTLPLSNPGLDVHALQTIEGHANPITRHDILIAAEILRDDPALTLSQASQQLSARLNNPCSARQLELTILLSVRGILMFDCPERGDDWKPGEPFVDFASRCFPTTSAPSVAVKQAIGDHKSMKAWKLKEKFRLSFRGTENLALHLHLDPSHPDGPTLYLFRHTAFIKAQLGGLEREINQEDGGLQREDGMPACLKRGYLPPQLLVETLHSIQAILFHFDDSKSRPILKRLIAKNGFDSDYGNAEGYKMFDDVIHDLEYKYWGERLAVLHGFTRERPPRNKFERWMRWQASESNAFAVALAALLISVVVGILGLGLAAFQSWVAWKAWKDPVSNDDGTAEILREIAELFRQQAQQARR